jgi:hypothetical protein
VGPAVQSGTSVALAGRDGMGDWSLGVGLPPGLESDDGAEALLALALLPAMRRGEPLEIDGPVSGRLLDGAEVVQDVLCTWDAALRPRDPWYRRVPVVAERRDRRRYGPGRGTAAFFTGGVDSFFTAVRHRDQLSALVYVHGFDVGLDAGPLRAEVSRRLGDAAEGLGLPLVEVETDLRRLGNRSGVPWDDHHGAALAAVALLLAPHFGRVLVPATHTYAHLEGLGSHPLLDPLWSTEDVDVVHDGAHASRADKIRLLADVPGARRHLRPCWENPGGSYACGRCEKCVRTGVAVRLAGAEGRFATVRPPSLRDVAGVRVTGRGAEWQDLRADLVRTDANPRLLRAVDVALTRHQLRRWRASWRWVR